MKTILVVDDEKIVVAVVGAILERRGYRVLTASGGAEAARLSDANPGAVDLLITNHCLTRESGRDVAIDLEAAQPGIKVLQISGYPEAFLIRDGTKVPNGSFLQKPFLPDELVNKVEEILKKGS